MKKSKLDPILGASVIFIATQALTLYIATLEKAYVEANNYASPQVSAGWPLAYFFGVVVVMGAVLFFIPVALLKILLRVMFTFLFSWGTFVVLTFLLPVYVAAPLCLMAGLVWLLRPRVWLHNLLMVTALVSAGVVFGWVLTPWAAMICMLVLSVYDVVAVRFGYMMWMATRLSESDTLPVFLIPKSLPTWNLSLKTNGYRKVLDGEAAEREFSILGGGDIGFPLLLAVSVFFVNGVTGFIIVSIFALAGLVAAYLIQLFFLKGKPMPALPPISFFSLIGFLIAQSMG